MQSSIGAGMRPSRKPKPVARPQKTQSPEAKKSTAIRLGQAMENLHLLDSDISEDAHGPIVSDGNPFFNDDDYDFSEYDQDSPLTDEDDLDFSSGDETFNLLESFQDDTSLSHIPNVIIDALGKITIPAELEIMEKWDSLPDPQDKWLACRKLREVMEALVLQFRSILLDPEKTLSDLPGLAQREFISKQNLDESLMSRIADRYIQTPFWGVVHLKKFFQGRKRTEESWESVLQQIRTYIEEEENLDRPKKTKEIWNRFKVDLQELSREDTTADNAKRTIRNHLREAGVPLETPRKEIFERVKQWVQDNGISRIDRSELPSIRQTLTQTYALFQTKKTLLCQKPQYRPFIENRIARVLHELNVEVTNG